MEEGITLNESQLNRLKHAHDLLLGLEKEIMARYKISFSEILAIEFTPRSRCIDW